MAQDQRFAAGPVASAIADRELDLRQAIADRQGSRQRAQRRAAAPRCAAAAPDSTVISATKLDFLSWKPTSTPPFLGTSRTDSRARCR